MTETKHGVDASFNDRLNILRAGVLGANDGIISIAGVVIGVASATSNLWLHATPSMRPIFKMGNVKRLLKS